MHLPELIGSSGLLFLGATNIPVKPWITRKIIHIGIGTILVNADVSDPNVVFSIYSTGSLVAGLSTIKKIKQLTDDKNNTFIKDIGIFSYVMSCLTCLFLQVPFKEIEPLFYSDPAGAIIGKTVNSPKIWENKTVAGTCAVFGMTLITVDGDIREKIFLAFVVTVIELFGGNQDNLLIGLVLIMRYLLENNKIHFY